MTAKTNLFFGLVLFGNIIVPHFQGCPLQCAQSNDTKTATPSVIKFVYIAHKKYPQVLGAVPLAVENVNKDPLILPNTTLKFEFAGLTDFDAHGKYDFVVVVVFFT